MTATVSERDELLLDNPAYAALTGPQAHFAHRSGRALRFPDDVCPFLGFPGPATDQDWRDAELLVPPGTGAGVIDDATTLPEGWRSPMRFDGVQMIGVNTRGAPEPAAIELQAHDVPEMLDLVARTQPGPFLPRTIEMGRYVGIRIKGELVAMAGERLHPEGWTEISAICTAPEHRGSGYASRLTRAVIAGIEARGARTRTRSACTSASASSRVASCRSSSSHPSEVGAASGLTRISRQINDLPRSSSKTTRRDHPDGIDVQSRQPARGRSWRAGHHRGPGGGDERQSGLHRRV
jgi:GNAT superfamily N-acetyltransferase